MFLKDQTTTQPKIPPQKTASPSIYPCTSTFICHLQFFTFAQLTLYFGSSMQLHSSFIIHATFLLYYKSHTPRERPPHAFHARRH
jgi:hypothetical protein